MNEISLTDKSFTSNPYGFSWSSVGHFRTINFSVDFKKAILNGRALIELSNYFRYF